METLPQEKTSNASSRLLNFDQNKVEILTLDELKETTGERYFGSKELNDISHHQFISKILQLVTRFGLEYEVDPIYAAQNKSKYMQGVSILPELEKTYGEKSVKAHILRRIMGRIQISNFSDEISNTSIAISYHQQGIEVAMGPNVKICQNQCILGADRYMRTYGKDKMPGYERVLEVLEDWLFKFEEIRKTDQELLRRMQSIKVSFEDMCRMIGELSLQRVGKDDLKMYVEYPLNQGQINNISKNYLKDVQARKDQSLDPAVTLYDVYNYGTAELKPSNMDIPKVLSQNNAFGEYIINLL